MEAVERCYRWSIIIGQLLVDLRYKHATAWSQAFILGQQDHAIMTFNYRVLFKRDWHVIVANGNIV